MLQAAKDETDEERKRAVETRASFNSEKKALLDKIEHLEQFIKLTKAQFSELQETIKNKEQTESMQKNELNYWNGKVSNMTRDIQMQQAHNQKVVQENRDNQLELDNLKRRLQISETNEQTLTRQI